MPTTAPLSLLPLIRSPCATQPAPRKLRAPITGSSSDAPLGQCGRVRSARCCGHRLWCGNGQGISTGRNLQMTDILMRPVIRPADRGGMSCASVRMARRRPSTQSCSASSQSPSSSRSSSSGTFSAVCSRTPRAAFRWHLARLIHRRIRNRLTTERSAAGGLLMRAARSSWPSHELLFASCRDNLDRKDSGAHLRGDRGSGRALAASRRRVRAVALTARPLERQLRGFFATCKVAHGLCSFAGIS